MNRSSISNRNRVWRALLSPVRLNPFGPGFNSLARAVEDSALPAPLQTLIHDLTRRSRLWHSERVDVARELITHFQDGLASGVSPEALATNFGDPAQAAALIRRAKKRGRPRAWRAMMTTFKGVAALLAVILGLYLLLAARAFLTTPNIARNYLAEINAATAKVSESDRAWPLYRRAYLAQPKMPKPVADHFPGITLEDPVWPAAVAYIKECEPMLNLIRQAATRPSFGVQLSNQLTDVEVNDHSFWLAGLDVEKAHAEFQAQRENAVPNPNPELIGVLLPYLGTMRSFARHLAFDTREASQSGDAARAFADLQSMYRMADHTNEDGFLISGLVRLAIKDLASQELGIILRDRPALLSDDQLASLAHLASRLPMKLELQGESNFMQDMLQRTYSDDGHGEGHLTAEGLRLLKQYTSAMHTRTQTPSGIEPFGALFTPITAGLAPSRRQVSDIFNKSIADTYAYAQIPPWKRTDEDNPDRFIASLKQDQISGSRYSLIALLTPALSSAVWSYDRAIQSRDAVLTAVALELHRRKHGSYPNSLAEIETSILPAIPLDIFDGQPLRFALREGKPVLYSIGVDRKDDGGRPPEKPNPSIGRPDQSMPASRVKDMLNDPLRRPAMEGDWILWPLPSEPAAKAKSDE